MSFILDALKKSETERQRASGPALFEVKVASPRARFPVWAVFVGVLLAVNLLVLLWVLLRNDKPTVAAQAEPGAAGSVVAMNSGESAQRGAAARSATPPPMPLGLEEPTNEPSGALPAARGVLPDPSGAPGGTVPRYTGAARNTPSTDRPAFPAESSPYDEAPAVLPGSPEAAKAAREHAQAQGAAAQEAARVQQQLQATATTATRAAALSVRTSGLPTRDELVNSGRARIPELQLSLHAYDPNPAKRFVFINGQRAHEGDAIANGVVLETITRDGAILSAGGQRFALPVQ